MTITFSGLASGLDTASWVEALVSVKQQAVTDLQTKAAGFQTSQKSLSTMKSYFSAFSSTLSKLADSKLSASSDVFSKFKTTSTNSSAVTATATGGAVAQNLDVEVSQLATSTVAQGSIKLGQQVTGSTKFSDLTGATTGTFSFYVDNKKYSIDITSSDSLDNIGKKMVDATKPDEDSEGLISYSIANGKFSVDAGDSSITLGSTQDKSNFVSTMALKKDASTNSYTSSTAINKFNMSAKLLGANSPFGSSLTAGTFEIGDAKFTIDENTTLSSLLNKINSTTDAGVTASVDSTTGTLKFTASSTGAFNIGMEDGSSNFLELSGLTSGGGIKAGTQTLGKNALLSVNGKDIESFSNSVTSETTGLAGVVLNLTAETEENKPASIAITQDAGSTVSSIKTFIADFNSLVSSAQSTRSTDSNFKYESGLSSIITNLRSASSTVTLEDGDYRTLADIGISIKSSSSTSTDADGNTTYSSSYKLELDEEKFNKALQQDPEAVKELVVGNLDNGTTGFTGKLQEIVDGSLKSTKGFFDVKSTNLNSKITSLNNKIDKKNDDIETYQARLEAKFSAMEKMISTMNTQYSSISGLFG